MANPVQPTVVEVDGRDLPPPEPMERVFAALENLPAGGEVRLLLWREPFPLYPLLRQAGFAWQCQAGDDQVYRIRIYQPGQGGALP